MLGGPRSAVRTHAWDLSCCAFGLRPAAQVKPGAAVSPGSLDPSLARLPPLLCFIPRSQTPAEGERSFYLPAAAASRSLLLNLHPSLLGSSPPPIRFLVTPASPLSLALWAVSEQLSMQQTHTLDPKPCLNDSLQRSNLNQTVAPLQHK